MSYYRSALQPYMHDSDQYESIEHSLQQLMACWEALQSQVSDKEARLEQTLLFHRLYQESITRISTWLDDVQLRLFNTALDTNTDERLKENDVSFFPGLCIVYSLIIFILLHLKLFYFALVSPFMPF